jgi:LAS superfamily LD-carboxypeptidase LdcB
MKYILTEASNGSLPESMLTYVDDPSGGKSPAKLNLQAAADFNRMVAAAKKDGIELRLSGPNSGYRPVGTKEEGCRKGFTQWCAWQKYKSGTGNEAAVPGKSNHGWGSAVDIKNCKGGSKNHKWLVANAKNFGFTPYSRESWHWDHKGSISSLGGGRSDTTTTTTTTNDTKPSSNDTTTSSNLDTKTSSTTTTPSKYTDLQSLMSLFSGDYKNMSTQEKNKALLPLFSMLGLDTFRELLDNPNVVGTSSSSDDVTKALEKIRGQMGGGKSTSSETNTISIDGKSGGSEISKLPQDIQDSIKKLKSEYGITVTDEHIKKEIDQEGNWKEDAGGVNTEAKKQIQKLISDAKSKFPKIGKLGIVSGYRSYGDQVKNFGNKAKSRGVDNTQKANTIPGFSQHHTGKAFDIFSVDSGWWSSNSDVKNWVADNAKKYGFDVTYKTQGPLRIAEPWHLYYVGGESINEETIVRLETIYEEINRIKNLMT